jgi:hypothetical protein
MSRLKHLWLSFWRKDHGLGMIEAAVTLPLFLMITFGVIEFGNMYIARYQSRDVASTVGDYLQANPSASSADLQTFVINLGFGSLKNTGPGEDNSVFATIKIQSGRTMLTAAQFDALCSGGDVKNWANPWLGGDPADDQNDYYIHVCYPYTYNTITPLPDLTVQAIPETKTMNSKALAYITVAQIISISECPEGQYMTGIRNNLPICRASKFGGTYTKGLGRRCVVPNTVTGDCTCPSWAPTQQVVSEFYNSPPHAYSNYYYCPGYSDSNGPNTPCGYLAIVCLP